MVRDVGDGTGEKQKNCARCKVVGTQPAFHALPFNKPANKTTFALIRQQSSTLTKAQYDSEWGNYRDISSLRLNPRSTTTMGGSPPRHPSIVFNNFNFAFAPTMITKAVRVVISHNFAIAQPSHASALLFPTRENPPKSASFPNPIKCTLMCSLPSHWQPHCRQHQCTENCAAGMKEKPSHILMNGF